METSIQGNKQINTGRIRGHIMVLVEMRLACQHSSINMVTMMLMGHCTITIEKRNDNTKSESIKINAKNSHPVRTICQSLFANATKGQHFWNHIFYFLQGSTIDHLVSSDEDEPIINLNHISHDTENEGMFPFRRSTSSQYHRVSQSEWFHSMSMPRSNDWGMNVQLSNDCHDFPLNSHWQAVAVIGLGRQKAIIALNIVSP